MNRFSLALLVLSEFLCCGQVLAAEAQKGKLKAVDPTSSGFFALPRDHSDPSAGTFQVYFERYGKAAPQQKAAIFLHGGPGNAFPFGLLFHLPKQGPILASHYEFLYFHQRGAGRTLTPEENSPEFVQRHLSWYRLDQHIEDLEFLRKAVFGTGRKITLMGGSWGGFLGLAYAVRYPQHVEGLYLTSFESTGQALVHLSQTMDRIMLKAALDVPTLLPALRRLKQHIDGGLLVWRRGRPEQATLQWFDALNLLEDLAESGQFQEMAEKIDHLIRNDPEGRAFLDTQDLHPGMIFGGRTWAAHATTCQALIDKDYLKSALTLATKAAFFDDASYMKALLRSCLPYFGEGKSLDIESALASLAIPAVVITGDRDPTLNWEATARVASKMPRATFLLVEGGGHSPFGEGDRCLGQWLETLALSPDAIRANFQRCRPPVPLEKPSKR